MSRNALARLLPLLLGLSFCFAAPIRAEDEEDEPGDMLPGDEALMKEQAKVKKALDELGKAAADGFEHHRYDEALSTLEKMKKVISGLEVRKELKDEQEAGVHYDFACAYALTGKKDDALGSFARAIEMGYANWAHIQEDTDLNAIREDDAFKKTIEKGKAAQRERGAARAKAVLDKPLADLELELTSIEGKPVKLADWKGKVVIVEIFGTWSRPCAEQVAHLAKLHQKLGAKGLEVVGIACEPGGKDAGESVLRFGEKLGVKFPLALGDVKALKNKVQNMTSFPTIVFLDRQGRVRIQECGFNPNTTPYEWFEGAATALLQDEDKK